MVVEMKCLKPGQLILYISTRANAANACPSYRADYLSSVTRPRSSRQRLLTMPPPSYSHSRSRSATPSHAGASISVPSPSRLVPPVLHSAPSLTNIRVYSNAPSVAATPISGSPPHGLAGGDSVFSSTSVMNEPSGSMLVLDTDIDEGDNVTASASVTGDEAERSLREQLKKSLHKPEASGMYVP